MTSYSYNSKQPKGKKEQVVLTKELLTTDAKYLSAEEIRAVKAHYAQLGEKLTTCIKNLTVKYRHVELEPDTIKTASRAMNVVEGKVSHYLSPLKVAEKWIERSLWMANHLQECNDRHLKAIAGRLCVINPNIRYLTGEKYTQDVADHLRAVFEGERQELYEATRKKQTMRVADSEIYTSLGDILQFCYRRCVGLNKHQVDIICNLLHMHAVTTATTGLLLRIKELQLLAVPLTLPFIQKLIRTEVASDPSCRVVVQTWRSTKPPLRTFLDKCTEICWRMLIHEPPMMLHFDSDDLDMFKPLLEEGNDIDYVIWPALLETAGGSVLIKGVAQFMFVDRSEASVDIVELSGPEVVRDKHGLEVDTNYYYHVVPKNYYYFTKEPE